MGIPVERDINFAVEKDEDVNNKCKDDINNVERDDIQKKQKKEDEEEKILTHDEEKKNKKVLFRPVYRFLAAEQPRQVAFSDCGPVVERIRKEAEMKCGQTLNYCLAQLYPKNDFITAHTDKTLDMARGTGVAVASFGATREMTLKVKRKKNCGFPAKEEEMDITNLDPNFECSIPLPNNSIYYLSGKTNRKMTHEIRKQGESSQKNIAYQGQRISLTFRHIATYEENFDSNRDGGEQEEAKFSEMSPSNKGKKRGKILWGQGVPRQNSLGAEMHSFGDETIDFPSNYCLATDEKEEARRLLRAFAEENGDPDFNWELNYGAGFGCTNDVLFRVFAEMH